MSQQVLDKKIAKFQFSHAHAHARSVYNLYNTMRTSWLDVVYVAAFDLLHAYGLFSQNFLRMR